MIKEIITTMKIADIMSSWKSNEHTKPGENRDQNSFCPGILLVTVFSTTKNVFF